RSQRDFPFRHAPMAHPLCPACRARRTGGCGEAREPGQAQNHRTTREDVLTDQQPEQAHELHLEAGKTYLIDKGGAAFDTYVKLLDADGKLLTDNDDVAEHNHDSRLIFTPEKDGTFPLVATSFQQRGRGAYRLTISALEGKRTS